MIPDILAQGDRFWKWPTYTYVNVVYAILIFFVAMVIYNIVSLFQKSRNIKQRNWSILEAFARRNKLSSKEINQLKIFYEKLPPEQQESLDFAFERTLFKKYLQKFLFDNKSLDTEEKVRVLDKLFPKKDHMIDIKSLLDLYEGEICAIETETLHFLVQIVKVTQKELLLSASEWKPGEEMIGKEIQLYCFRPEVGGFLLHGKIRAIVKSGMIFTHDGRIESKGDQHLMAEVSFPIEFSSWSIKRVTLDKPQMPELPKEKPVVPEPAEFIELDEEIDKTLKDIADTSNKASDKIHEYKKETKIAGVTEKISDRAILFNLAEGIPSDLHNQDIWEMKLTLGDGMILKCRGNIIKTQGTGKYIFKFIDATETMRRVLFEEIKKFNPVRERLL